MSLLRLGSETWTAMQAHFAAAPLGERFGFLLARWFQGSEGPAFLAESFHAIADDQVMLDHGYSVNVDALLAIFNEARRQGLCVVEVHTHPFGRPGFSHLDREGLKEISTFAFRTLDAQPYGALVWVDRQLYGEWFTPGSSGRIERISVAGNQLYQATTHDHRARKAFGVETSDRQVLWLGADAQRQIERCRVAVVGCGGTGSHVIQQLIYAGFGDVILVDPDRVDITNLNRLVTAGASDVGRLKTELAGELVRRVNPNARATTFSQHLFEREPLEALKTADLIFGCLDNDGARLALNDLAIAYRVPLIDIGVGIQPATGSQNAQAGGRVAFVVPGEHCLSCMGLIDIIEAGYVLSLREERDRARQFGYVAEVEMPAPAVISLNGIAASIAVNETLLWVAGVRRPYPLIDIDALGFQRPDNAPWVGPRRRYADPGQCVACAQSGQGDHARIDKYQTSL